MNDEIINDISHIVDYLDKVVYILKNNTDYITNLQKENLALARENEKEKQFIKDCGFQNQQQLALMYLDYKSRVEKASEDIKDIFKDEKWYENYEYNDLENALKNVLNILQNGSDASVKD